MRAILPIRFGMAPEEDGVALIRREGYDALPPIANSRVSALDWKHEDHNATRIRSPVDAGTKTRPSA